MSKSKSLAILTLVLVALCLPAASIYAWQRNQLTSENEVAKQALNYLYDAPTFLFDGIRESVRILKVIQSMIFTSSSWLVNVEFDCSHTGYGDRSGEIVQQMIQHHTAVLLLTDGKVTSMVIDNAWDELADKLI